MSSKLIESQQYIPWVMRQSRDVKMYCKLLDLLINNFKTNADYWVSLIDFDSCPNKLLPLLASYVGYRYNYQESYDTNRLIIKHYPEMIKNRGSKIGMSLATALSVNTLGEIDQVEALATFRIELVTDENKIKIYIYFPTALKKTRDLLEIVRPAGCGLELVPADLISTIDGIKVHLFSTQTRYTYDITRYSISRETRVGFSEITNQNRE